VGRNQGNTAEPLQVDLSREERRGFGGGFWSAAEEAQWQNMTEGVAESRYQSRRGAGIGGVDSGLESNDQAMERYGAMSQGYGSEWQYIQGDTLGLYRAKNTGIGWVRDYEVQPGDPEYDRARSSTSSDRTPGGPPPAAPWAGVTDRGSERAPGSRGAAGPGGFTIDVDNMSVVTPRRPDAPKPSFTASQVGAGSNTAMLAAQAAAQAAVAKRAAYNQQVIAARLQRAQGAAARPVGSGTTFVQPKAPKTLGKADWDAANKAATTISQPWATPTTTTTTTTQPTRTRVLEGGV